MIQIYEKVFNEKINHFSEHKLYPKLRESADQALRYHTGFGVDAIHAGDFMDRIVCLPITYIAEWLNGNNGLEWIDKKTGERYSDKISDGIKRWEEQNR